MKKDMLHPIHCFYDLATDKLQISTTKIKMTLPASQLKQLSNYLDPGIKAQYLTQEFKLQQCTIPFKDYLLKDLAQPEFAKGYLETVFQDFDKDGNIEILLLAMKDIAEAQGGIEELVTWTNLSPETLTICLIPSPDPNWIKCWTFYQD